MTTYLITIAGQVQGIGFRPFIYQLAIENEWLGTVHNTGEGVDIKINGDEEAIASAIEEIKEKAPKHSRLRDIQIRKIESQAFSNFTILESKSGSKNCELTPDLSPCKDCLQEISQSNDNRQNYPFTTCTQCGPRYSIINRVPYDRENTTMSVYNMCKSCTHEYTNPANRRFHSQTNSCHECAIPLRLYENNKVISTDIHSITSTIVKAWQQGRTVAIKGLGGYLITGDATNPKTIQEIRSIKQRPTKPFALMCPNQDFIDHHFESTQQTRAEHQSPATPIVLIKPKDPKSFQEGIAPGLDLLGVMLPSTPLLYLLLQDFKQAIIATSANTTHEPIIFEDDDALRKLKAVDLILAYDRNITFPQDDSLLKITPRTNTKIILRRSRGMAPSFPDLITIPGSEEVLAFGVDMKNAFGYLSNQRVSLSQYLGNLTHFEAQKRQEMVLKRFLHLFETTPQLILTDLHQGYESTVLGKTYAQKLGVKQHNIQHHEAHFAAILTEYKLWEKNEKVLGVIWDGTGLGHDGNIWGGEFFCYDAAINRVGHLDYWPHIAGDKMSLEPRISALSLITNLGLPVEVKHKFSEVEYDNYQQLTRNPKVFTSSMGRLFDAVASILSLCDFNDYEGQAAMLVEQEGEKYAEKHGLDFEPYPFHIEQNKIDPSALITELANEQNKGLAALRFHLTLIEMVSQMATLNAAKHIAFSGGVFQNGLLVDLLKMNLGKTKRLYFHNQLSPNDENIALGQIAHHYYSQS